MKRWGSLPVKVAIGLGLALMVVGLHHPAWGRTYKGRVTGRLFLIQDGNGVHGEVLDSSDRGARGELDGVVDGRRVNLRRRFAWAGPQRQHELTLTMEAGGTRLQGSIVERGVGVDFQAERIYPVPQAGPGPTGPNPGPFPPGPGPRGPVVVAPPPPAPTAVPEERLAQVIAGMQAETWDEGKLTVLRQAVVYDFYDVGQVVRILALFSFDDPKLAALEIMRPRILDPQNALRVPELFTFPRTKDKARAILAPR
jgi:hypothetical protein